jgi:hypothetical protein
VSTEPPKYTFAHNSILQSTQQTMKLIVSILALAATVLSTPTPQAGACTPATYDCNTGKTGWRVCNTRRVWEVRKLEIPKWVYFYTLAHILMYPTEWWQLRAKYRMCFLPTKPFAILCASRIHIPNSSISLRTLDNNIWGKSHRLKITDIT